MAKTVIAAVVAAVALVDIGVAVEVGPPAAEKIAAAKEIGEGDVGSEQTRWVSTWPNLASAFCTASP